MRKGLREFLNALPLTVVDRVQRASCVQEAKVVKNARKVGSGVFFLSPFSVSPTALPEGEETNSDTCAGNSEGKDRKTPESGDRKGNYVKRRHVCMAEEPKVGEPCLHT